MVAAGNHRNFSWESLIPPEFSVENLIRTWIPRFVPFHDYGEWPPYDGPRYIADEDYKWQKHGSRKRLRHKMVMDQVSGRTRRGRATPFLTDPELYECGKCGRLGHNSRTCHWQIAQVQLHYIHKVFFAHLYFDVPLTLQYSFRFCTYVPLKFCIIFILVLMFISNFL
jgi:hypothetical protein